MRKTWPHWGGKTRVLPTLLPLLPAMTRQIYVEPFVGSGVVGLNLDIASPKVLADLDPMVIKKLETAKDMGASALREAVNQLTTYVQVEDKEERRRRHRDLMLQQDTLPPGVFHIAATVVSALGVVKLVEERWVASPHLALRVTKRTSIDVALDVYLTNASLICAPYQDTLKRVKGLNAYVYLDPPYVATNSQPYISGAWDIEQFLSLLQNVRENCRNMTVVLSSPEYLREHVASLFPLVEVKTFTRHVRSKAGRTKKESMMVEAVYNLTEDLLG